MGGEKYCQFLVLIGELCQVGHGGQKLEILCILNQHFAVLINLFYRLNFLFRLMENGFFLCECCFILFC